MVPVVVLLEDGEALAAPDSHHVGERVDVVRVVRGQLFLRDAADACELGKHADVLQVVELAEDGQLAELADSRDEHEAQELVARLERGVELAYDVAERIELFRFVDHVEQGGVVLVDKHDDLLAGLAVSRPDELLEARAGRLGLRGAPFHLRAPQGLVEEDLECVEVARLHGREVHAHDGERLPFGLESGNRKAVEQLFLAFEIRFHGGEEQRLAEAARAAEEERLAAGLQKRMDVGGLVDVAVEIAANLFKRLHADGEPAWGRLCVASRCHLVVRCADSHGASFQSQAGGDVCLPVVYHPASVIFQAIATMCSDTRSLAQTPARNQKRAAVISRSYRGRMQGEARFIGRDAGDEGDEEQRCRREQRGSDAPFPGKRRNEPGADCGADKLKRTYGGHGRF